MNLNPLNLINGGPVLKYLSYGACTHTGNVRDHNEDFYLADADLGLWLVADGMGGHACGEVASEITANTIHECIRAGSDIDEAIQIAHSAVVDAPSQGKGMPGMGSTVVALTVKDNAYKLAWVGDSRGYLWNKKLHQLTTDHSLVQMLLEIGQITEEQAWNHPQKNVISQHVGARDVDRLNVGMIESTFNKGEKLLLCSDGLSDEMRNERIGAHFALGMDANGVMDDQFIAENLVRSVLSGRAKDNVTVIVVSAPE